MALQSVILLWAGTVAFAQPSVTTVYEYDLLGNREMATDLLRLADARILSASPTSGVHGDVVNMFGRNLPAENSAGFAAAFNGVPAEVISVGTSVVTVQVPPGATTGSLIVTLPDASQFDLGTFRVEGVDLTPVVNRIVYSQTIQFNATLVGVVDPSVNWEVLTPFGQDPENSVGTITVDGLYSPPLTSDSDAIPEAIVRATSVELPLLSAMARVQLVATTHSGGRTPVALVSGSDEPGGTRLVFPALGPIYSIMAPAFGGGVVRSGMPAQHPRIMILLPVFGPLGLPVPVFIASPPVDVGFAPELRPSEE